MQRILLSVPHVGRRSADYVQEAFASNWLSTVGPNVSAFEADVEACLGIPALALVSGTAAIHLGLRLLGVSPGDVVFCQTLTFVASANPITYLGAQPVFIDSEPVSWNLDPEVLAKELAKRAAVNRLPRAVVVVDLFGQCADMDPIVEVCGRYEVPVLEDAAEALGATYKLRPAGTLGDVGALSFNGNKIITTTGGGMLLSRSREQIQTARFWAGQSREPGVAYEHHQVGYNYRMSNVLAGIGRGQLLELPLRVQQRRAIAFRYRDAFADLDGIGLMPQAPYGVHTNWLSCFLVDQRRFGYSRDDLLRHLDAAGIEARPVWKPMHLQPLFHHCEYHGTGIAERLFEAGICLPSSSSLPAADQLYVANEIRKVRGAAPLSAFPRSAPPEPVVEGAVHGCQA